LSANTIEQLESAFYEAFMQGDLEALMAVWWMDDSIECIHPFGPRLTGYKSVYSSWQDVIKQSRGMHVELKQVHRHAGGDLVVHTLVEEVSWSSDDGRHSTEINSTHVFRNTESGWRLVVRHSSPSPSQDLMADVQEMELH
jgi:ketosteroid isomerase-like protein